MALLRRCYAKLHLLVNESKSTVASVFGRKFLGYSLWVARGDEVKRKVAEKPLTTFKQRIRELTCRSGGRSMSEVVERLRSYMLGWKGYFGLAQTQRFGGNSMNGCVTGCGRSSLNTGSAERPCIGN